MALTASGQSIIVGGVALNSGTSGEVVDFAVAFAAGFEADWALCLAQQSCECIEAQVAPAATIVSELAGDATSLAAAALTIFSQPSMQPAPAIQKATASASDTRIILVEEKNLMMKMSVDP